MSQGKCPVDHVAGADKCPVEPSRSSWLSFLSKSPTPPDNTSPQGLSTSRTPSSIPKQDAGTWTYPSEAQFFAAMARKNHNPNPSDMKTIVPIHNAVNERAWGEVMRWEQGRGGEKCGGVKLVNFRGKPGERSWKAWGKVLLGYSPPFDRHDWVVDRCGTRMRYIIDFYTGHSPGPSSSNLSFYLDVRPAMDNWEGVRMRAEKIWERWFAPDSRTSPNATSAV